MYCVTMPLFTHLHVFLNLYDLSFSEHKRRHFLKLSCSHWIIFCYDVVTLFSSFKKGRVFVKVS